MRIVNIPGISSRVRTCVLHYIGMYVSINRMEAHSRSKQDPFNDGVRT